MSSATCPNLASGTTINGSGIEKSITNQRTDRRRVTTTINVARDRNRHGPARERLRVQLQQPFPRLGHGGQPAGQFAGKMVDSFSLAGQGPERLHNGFLARFTTDFTTFFSFEPIHSRGDPISFPDGNAHCDPL